MDGLEAEAFIRRLSKGRDATPGLFSVAAEPRSGSGCSGVCSRTSQERF